jgi:two-component system, NtrC family, response regulator
MSEKPILLVVEDDEGLQRQLRWAYEDYQVVSATTRAEAIALLPRLSKSLRSNPIQR